MTKTTKTEVGEIKETDVSDVSDTPLPAVKEQFTKEKEAAIFKALAHKSYKEVAKDFGIHLVYPGNDKKITSFIYNIAKKIRKAPELWGIATDTVEVVQEAIDKRSIKKNPGLKGDIAIMEESFRDKLDALRDTAAEILSKKLKKYNTTKGMEDISVRDLKDLLVATIDKSRLLRGESTENIKKLSPLNVEDMSPEEALSVVMKARDAMIEAKK